MINDDTPWVPDDADEDTSREFRGTTEEQDDDHPVMKMVEPEDLTSDDDSVSIREHYTRSREVFEELAHVGGCETMGIPDKNGWYIYGTPDMDALEAGWTSTGTPRRLGSDLDDVIETIDRTLYALTSYKTPEALTVTRLYDGDEWEPAGKPSPDPEDIRAVAAFGDIDLADDLKHERGDLPDDVIETAEAALDAYVDEFADLYGDDRSRVYGVDSVGGAYLMGAPEATLPIAAHFDGDDDALRRVMTEFIDRSNEWLKEAQERVESRVPDAHAVIDPDWVNNHNRMYKIPMSVHQDHDAVATPLDTSSDGSLTYDVTPLDAVDDETRRAAAEWARDFSATEHTDAVEALVTALWTDYMDDADSWEDALDEWLEDEREAHSQRLDDLRDLSGDHSETVELDGHLVTTEKDDVLRAVKNDLDVEAVADEFIVESWTDQASGMTDRSGSGKRAFIPTWGGSANSGNANYIDTRNGIWYDSSESHGGGPVQIALIGSRDVKWAHGETPSGRGWGRGLDILREHGFAVPLYVPEHDAEKSTDDRSPNWSVVQSALAFGVVDEEELKTHDTDDGATYHTLPDQEAYVETLQALEDCGVDHGWEVGALEDWMSDLAGYIGDESARELAGQADLMTADVTVTCEHVLGLSVVAREARVGRDSSEVPDAALVAVGRRVGVLDDDDVEVPDEHRETLVSAFGSLDRGDL